MAISYGITREWTTFTSEGRDHIASNLPVKSGLVFNVDAGAISSYPGTGPTLYDLSGNSRNATLYGNYSYSNGTVRLNNPSSDSLQNVSFIQLPSTPSITTVSLWFYQHSANATRYLLDGRTGGSGAFIYNVGSPGSNWASGTIYVNGENLGTISFGKVEDSSIGNWVNVVLTANTSFTDDMHLFSRFSNNEGMDITFSSAQIYNRVLSEKEINLNFKVLRLRYGI